MSVFAWFGVACAVMLAFSAACTAFGFACAMWATRRDGYMARQIIAHAYTLSRWCATHQRATEHPCGSLMNPRPYQHEQRTGA